MAFIRQRFPVYTRPIPFLVGAAMFVVGLWQGLNWTWDWALQTGNIFIQINIPTKLIVLTDYHGLFLALCVGGLLVIGLIGRTSREHAQEILDEGGPGLWGPRFRFYPLTLLFGLFLGYYGTVFLFNAIVQADNPPGGFVAFVYLNYAGIMDRGIISVFGFLVGLTGVLCATVFAFTPGLGLSRPERTPTRATWEPSQEPPLLVAPEPAPAPPPMPAPVRARPAPNPTRATPAGARRSAAPVQRGSRVTAARPARTQAP